MCSTESIHGRRSLAAADTNVTECAPGEHVSIKISKRTRNHTCRSCQGGRRCQKFLSISHMVEPLKILRGAPGCMQPVAPRTFPDVGPTPKPRGGHELCAACAMFGCHACARLVSSYRQPRIVWRSFTLSRYECVACDEHATSKRQTHQWSTRNRPG